MTTDFRALCVDLARVADALDGRTPLTSNQGQALDGYSALAEFRHVADRARAVLADGPAVPEGREPASVTGQPSDEDLLGIACQSIEPYDKIRPGEYESETECVIEVYGSELVTFARAVLTRWGNPAPQPPAEGEVGELVQHLHHAAEVDDWDGASPEWCQSMLRAADLLQRLSPPQPPAEGEVGDRVAWLRRFAAVDWIADETADKLYAIADILSQHHPAPVPVSERLPGPEDCDAEGRCWFLRFPFDYSRESWSLEDRTYGCNTGFTHWLPAHDLPIPHQQESING